MVYPSPLPVELKNFVAAHLFLNELDSFQDLQRLGLHCLPLPRQCIHHSTVKERITVKTPGLSFNHVGNRFSFSTKGFVQTL